MTWSGGRALAGYVRAAGACEASASPRSARLRPRVADVLRAPRSVLATDVEADALARVAGAPGDYSGLHGPLRHFGDAPLPACDTLVASDVGYTEKLALGFARRAAEAVAAGAAVVTSDSTKLRWTEFLEASRLTGRDVKPAERDKSNPYVRPASVAVLRPFRIGSRPSKLAIVQAERVGALSTSHLRLCLSTRRVIYKEARRTRRSRGKEWTLRDRSTTLWLDGTIDATAWLQGHTPQNRWRAGLRIAACLPRADVQDVLVGPYASVSSRIYQPAPAALVGVDAAAGATSGATAGRASREYPR